MSGPKSAKKGSYTCAGREAARVRARALSGRALRKLPFLAHATAGDAAAEQTATVAEFLEALYATVMNERADRAAMGAGAKHT